MKAHKIENNKVINTIEVESLTFMPNLIDGSIGGIGWDYVNGVLSEPIVVVAPALVPESITKIQAMDAMLQTDVDTVAGTSLWTSFKSVIAQNAMANDRWLLAQILKRSDPFVAEIGTALNKTTLQIDELFILGESL